VGPAGPTGPQGANGAAHAYFNSNNTLVTINNSYPVVASVTVPAGSYLLFGKTWLQNVDGDDQFASCVLSTGDTTYVHLSGEGDGGSSQSVSVQDAVANVPDGTTFTMTCATYNAAAQGNKLTAIAVDAIN
jgi:hypothetical protein